MAYTTNLTLPQFELLEQLLPHFQFKNAEKHYYYIATLFIIPLFTCLIVVFGWDLDNRKG
jgi:hypothetical protein